MIPNFMLEEMMKQILPIKGKIKYLIYTQEKLGKEEGPWLIIAIKREEEGEKK